MKKGRLAGALSALVLGSAAIGFAIAQVNPPIPTVVAVDPTDLFLDVVHGSPTTVSQYAKAGQIAGVSTYTYNVPLTAFSITAGNYDQFVYLNPAGTLATGTFTFAPNPGDGQHVCVVSTQTQTALTPTANTGQSIGGTAVTALTAQVPVCWLYRAANQTWYRYL